MRMLIAAAALALLATPVAAQPSMNGALALKGAEGQAATLSAADLAKLPRVKFTFDAHGQKHDYEGPLLIDVLAKVGVAAGKPIGGKQLADVVLVTASDGYAVALGLGEADPATRPNRIIVADRQDGQPLSAKDGPFKLVVEGDLRPARSARQVTAIAVIPMRK